MDDVDKSESDEADVSDDAQPFACYSKHRTDRHEYF